MDRVSEGPDANVELQGRSDMMDLDPPQHPLSIVADPIDPNATVDPAGSVAPVIKQEQPIQTTDSTFGLDTPSHHDFDVQPTTATTAVDLPVAATTTTATSATMAVNDSEVEYDRHANPTAVASLGERARDATPKAMPDQVSARLADLPAQGKPHGSEARVYLNKHVTPHLLEGMKYLAVERPEKPLKWLSEYLASISQVQEQ